MRNFVCLRIRKLHDWGSGAKKNGKKINGVEGLTAHDLRLIKTLNADPKLLREIKICSEETNWKTEKLSEELAKRIGADKVDFISKKAKARIEKLEIADNKPNSCKAANIMLMVSPQWLRDGSETNPINESKSNKWTQIANDFLRERFRENYLAGIGHLDELNPHWSGYVLPAVYKSRKKRGRKAQGQEESTSQESWGLDSKSMFTPDKKVTDPNDSTGSAKLRMVLTGTCSKLQSEFAEYCQKHGLDVVRGVVASRAKYQEIAEFNHLLRAQSRTRAQVESIYNVEQLQKLVISGSIKAQDYDRIARDLDRLKMQIAEQESPLLVRLNVLERLIDEKEAERKKLADEISAKSRSVSVGDLIERLTGVAGNPTPDPKIYQYILHTGMILEVDRISNKFRNLTPDIKGLGNMESKTSGRGGIDTAIYLTGCTPAAANLLIADLFSVDTATATLADAIHDSPMTDARLELANNSEIIRDHITSRTESKWPNLRDHLIVERNFNKQRVDQLKEKRLIWANPFGHLVSVRFTPSPSENKITGSFVEDIQNAGHGFYSEYGSGITPIYHDTLARETVIAESHVEALDMMTIQAQKNERRNIFVIGKSRKIEKESLLRQLASSTKLLVIKTRSKFLEWVRSIIPIVIEIPKTLEIQNSAKLKINPEEIHPS